MKRSKLSDLAVEALSGVEPMPPEIRREVLRQIDETGVVRDRVEPGEKWEFDQAVTNAFEDMLRRSIPQYDVMRISTFDLARRYVREGTDVVDLGCSRGDALAPFVDKFGAHNAFVGVEVSKPMIAAARARFEGYARSGVVRILDHDLRVGMPSVRASVVLSVLTLQFVPMEYRQGLVNQVFDSLVAGGAFLLVEKVLGRTARTDMTMVACYLDHKRAAGYTEEQILRKKAALEGVLVPCTARFNEEMLDDAGFRGVDCYWRWMNFAGWLAVKP